MSESISTSIDPTIFIAHFNHLKEGFAKEASNGDQDATELTYICELIVETVAQNIHPISILSKEAVEKVYAFSHIRLDLINLTDIPFPKDSKTEAKKISKKKIKVTSSSSHFDSIMTEILEAATRPSNPSPSFSCKYYSCSQNLSDHYKYANPVDLPTCSHSNPPYGLHCPAGVNHERCGSYVPDTSLYAQFSIEEQTYSVQKVRTPQGIVSLTISDDQDNILNELTFFANEFLDISTEDMNAELRQIINSLHYNLTSKNINPSQLEQEFSSSNSSNSYISTLIG